MLLQGQAYGPLLGTMSVERLQQAHPTPDTYVELLRVAGPMGGGTGKACAILRFAFCLYVQHRGYMLACPTGQALPELK